GDREFDEFEKEIFLFLGIGIWQTISKIHRPLPLVLPILLDEIEEDNLNLLDSLKNLSEKKFIDRIGQIIDSYPQPAILFYIVDTLIEDVETEISSEKLGLMFIHLKIVIESFQKAIAFKKENFQTK
ncbi:MAG: hypothetical protein N3A65_09860, partial [candidate division WOR-3 bacterium]|nr:hypothetical protein [candidate division WOR-3 bacterium]